MALTLLAQQWAKQNGVTMVALTVDHRLRPESSAEAAQVAAWMRARGIAHHILTPEHAAHSPNLQENARQWRYDALADYCRTHGILHCLLAHHAGDNRETVHHHLARGETADGPSGMGQARNYCGVRFLRPLLACERPDLEAYLRAQGCAWVDDPSNHNPRFARVRTRTVLAQDAALAASLDAQLADARTARTARDRALAEAAMQSISLHPLGFAELDLERLRALEPALASQLLADSLRTIDGGPHRPRARDTARLMEALHAPNFTRRTLNRCELRLNSGRLRIAREMARVAAPMILQGSGECVWDGRFTLRYALEEPASLTLRALGQDGRTQLRARFSFHDTIPLSSPSLWHLDELLFVPHITGNSSPLPRLVIGFAPAKPLAAAPFW
jgi:tRNA(Ile)-lysidine synthase